MASESTNETERFSQSLKNLEKVSCFSGPVQLFWQSFLESMAGVAGARLGILAGKTTEETSRWKRVAIWPADGLSQGSAKHFLGTLETATSACIADGHVLNSLNGQPNEVSRDFLLGIRVKSEAKEEIYIAAFLLLAASKVSAEEALRRLQLAVHAQSSYHLRRAVDQAQAAVSQVASVLDLVVLLNAKERFVDVAMTFCNELAARHKCERVSLGWLDRGYARVHAISHMERFEKKMAAVKALEQAMEEALDQDEVIVFPPPEGNSAVTRDHATFAKDQGVNFMCSVPLHLDGHGVGIVSFERSSGNFSEIEVSGLTLSADVAARRLSDLKRRDRWFGARFALWAKEKAGHLVGVEHTWAKLLSVIVAVAIFVLFFGKMTYRVEAPFILHTDNVALLSAPFNGYIDEVRNTIGDEVKKDSILLMLDTRELLLQEAAAMADQTRYEREAEKARAGKALADMRIAAAQADQARAQLEITRYRINQSAIKAPFDGVIIEGDLKKRIGSPVQQGDLLFKIARIDETYVECDVNEKDVHEVRGNATGEIAFASQPNLKFPIHVTRIEPAAQPKQKGNVFIVRCAPQDRVKNWWRPGMSGVAKINVEKRTFFWIITHRTVDFLRMYFWW